MLVILSVNCFVSKGKKKKKNIVNGFQTRQRNQENAPTQATNTVHFCLKNNPNLAFEV